MQTQQPTPPVATNHHPDTVKGALLYMSQGFVDRAISELEEGLAQASVNVTDRLSLEVPYLDDPNNPGADGSQDWLDDMELWLLTNVEAALRYVGAASSTFHQKAMLTPWTYGDTITSETLFDYAKHEVWVVGSTIERELERAFVSDEPHWQRHEQSLRQAPSNFDCLTAEVLHNWYRKELTRIIQWVKERLMIDLEADISFVNNGKPEHAESYNEFFDGLDYHGRKRERAGLTA